MIYKSFKLWILINFSRTIPPDSKRNLKRLLIHSNIMPKSFHNTKNLFVHFMSLNSYDIFTSSILALHYNNGLSLNILLRAQIENYFLTEFFLDNPNEIQNVLKKEIWKSSKSKLWHTWFKNKQKDQLGKVYNSVLSKVAHPLPHNLLFGTDFVSFMKPKNESVNLKDFLDLSSQERTERFNEFFELDYPSPSLSAVPHNSMSKNSRDARAYDLLNLYVKVNANLRKIETQCPDYEIRPEDWTAIVKDYKRL